jgi:hypothetical protein
VAHPMRSQRATVVDPPADPSRTGDGPPAAEGRPGEAEGKKSRGGTDALDSYR